MDVCAIREAHAGGFKYDCAQCMMTWLGRGHGCQTISDLDSTVFSTDDQSQP